MLARALASRTYTESSRVTPSLHPGSPPHGATRAEGRKRTRGNSGIGVIVPAEGLRCPLGGPVRSESPRSPPLDSVVYYGPQDPFVSHGEHSLTIGQVAKRAGVGVETVRFYERQGLVLQPLRRASGYRQYPFDAVQRIRFIRQAKELGFSLKEIGELLELRVDPSSTCGDVKRRAEAKMADIDGRMRQLAQMRGALEGLVAECSGRGPTRECPILAAIDPDGQEADDAG